MSAASLRIRYSLYKDMALAPLRRMDRQSDIQRERYKDSIYPEGLEKTPPRFAIYKRNLWMIEKSDIVVTYVKNVGGAATFKEISEKKGKTVFNITL